MEKDRIRMTYSIWIVTPPGYTHSRCFEEVALSLQEAFEALGHDVSIVNTPYLLRGTVIVLGTHLLPYVELPPLPLILFNLEQILEDSPWLKPEYLQLLKHYPVWDYSPQNIAALARYGIQAILCGVGYMPGLARIAKAQIEDIDVLFIGSLNARRRAILAALNGRRVVHVFDLYGPERDAFIARAKIVLNVHYYESKVFEIVRVSFLLANQKCVVSELGQDEVLEAMFREGIRFVPYDSLAQTCFDLLERPQQRHELAAKGFAAFRAMSQVPMLQQALAATNGSHQMGERP
jgi:hypothetical protein